MTLPQPPWSNKPPNSQNGIRLEVPQHGNTHVALVPTLNFFFQTGTSSAGSFPGRGTLKTSSFLPPQTTKFCHFCLRHQQCLQKNPLPYQFSNCLISHHSTPHPLQGMARPTSLAEDNVPSVHVQIFDPRDLHRYYPATFNFMPSEDEEQSGDPCPSTKAVIPFSIHNCLSACPTLLTKDKPTAVSTWSRSRSHSQSTTCLTKPPVSKLEALDSKPKDGMKPSDSYAQAAVWPPSPDASKPNPVKVAIASAMSKLMTAIKRHQSGIPSLLWSVALGATVSTSKIQRLRADNIARMTSTTICVQQAGGMRFSLERLHKIACSEEKEARLLFKICSCHLNHWCNEYCYENDLCQGLRWVHHHGLWW